MRPRVAVAVLNVAVWTGASVWANDGPAPLSITRTSGAIKIDGDLSDPGWTGAARIDTWYETNPGDNTPAAVKNVGWLAYDDRYFYAGFEFHDPDPRRIRAPLGDRDNVPGYTDYGGVILDTRNDRRTGVLLLANARGVQYDAVSDDGGGGEDSSPDLFWDAAGRITSEGWILEMRVPFSSLRYARADPQTWGIMLYRNYPRAFRYQFFSTTLPRGGNCFICRSNALTGLEGLPSGGHLVLAPYVNGSRTDRVAGDLGSPLRHGSVDGEIGADFKWTPSAQTAVDATVNPDFSQIESDVAQIAVNERFALLFPEKRPFFLEGIELFATPLQAVYTRTITAPRWGVRTTGKAAGTGYTALLAEDGGGGSVILPGPQGSEFADQDFRSYAAIGRARRDVGRSFVSLLASAREVKGGGYNRVVGPDFQWRPSQADSITGQILISRTRTPERTDLAATWDGRRASGHGGTVSWAHSTPRVDWYGQLTDVSDGFRADNGFIPQVDYRQTFLDTGVTFRPTGLLRRLRTYFIFDRQAERDGDLLLRQVSVGTGMDGRWSSFLRVRYADERVRAGSRVLPRRRVIYTFNASPSQKVASVAVEGDTGEQIDFAGSRVGTGTSLTLRTNLRPTSHLELAFNNSRRWLNLDAPGGGKARLFTAQVDRLRATYTFTSRAFLRTIAQWVETRRDPALYTDVVGRRSGGLGLSALFAYKLNWQTVLFVGYGDNRTLSDVETLAPEDRQFFVKVSYALQR